MPSNKKFSFLPLKDESPFINFPDEILVCIFKNLTKKDVANMRLVHSNFDNAVKNILLHSIVVVTRDKSVYSFPSSWNDYTFVKSDAFFHMFRSQYFDPEYNKRLIFMGPLSTEEKYVERLKHTLNDVQVYDAAPFNGNRVVCVTLSIGTQPQAYWLVIEHDLFGDDFRQFGKPPITPLSLPEYSINEMKILSLKANFLAYKINCKSIILTGLNYNDMLSHFNYSTITKLSILQETALNMSSFTRMAQFFINLKEFGIVDSANFSFQQFVLGLRSNSLTRLETKCEIDSFGLEFDNIIHHHSRSLETIIHHYKDNKTPLFARPERGANPKEMPLGFRLLKLDDFPKLILLKFDGGRYSVDRSGHKPKMVYLTY